MINEVNMQFMAKSENESLARVTAAAFVTPLNPTIAEITEIKTAISEAVTNAIIHGYEGIATNDFTPQVHMRLHADIAIRQIYVEIIDHGRGIQDISKAGQPLFTSKPEMERSGMGFTVMEEFMDNLEIESTPETGTTIRMMKKLG